MNRLLVLNLVALTKDMIGDHTPHLKRAMKNGSWSEINPLFPAVTSTSQSHYVTGQPSSHHGVVANGWYFKDLQQIFFWRQANSLVKGPMVWDEAKKLYGNQFRTANLFWWFNMYNSSDYSVTVRPMYPADGRKIPDIYCHKESLRWELNDKLGSFPLFNFWGPTASIQSSEWIKNCALHIEDKYQPNLSMVYLPHLDYGLQKWGPGDHRIEKELADIDKVVGQLIQKAESQSMSWMILNEYNISKVHRPVYINRFLRKKSLIKVRTELDREILDPGASDAFAVCDHQVAHLYTKPHININQLAKDLKALPGIKRVLTKEDLKKENLNHERSGDIVLESDLDSWFCYYYWMDDLKAPDFATTVDIHRKPGYDPVELFFNPSIKALKLKIIKKLALKKLGFRQLMDFIPLQPELVKGSHGALGGEKPIIISSNKNQLTSQTPLSPTKVQSEILKACDPTMN